MFEGGQSYAITNPQFSTVMSFSRRDRGLNPNIIVYTPKFKEGVNKLPSYAKVNT
jgi:hypothetical protein